MRNLAVLLVLVSVINAAKVVGVLEIVAKSGVEDISIDEMRHLTDELRRQATLALPQKNYSVLTRDNIIALMPPDEAEAECLAESCAVDIGRAIGAEFVSQGGVGKFSDEYSLSIELYETMGGKLLGSIVMESKDIKGLLNAIREQSPALFAKIHNESDNPTNPNHGAPQSNSGAQIPNPEAQIPSSTKSNTMWIAIGLDIVGAAMLGVGIYQQVQKTNYYNDYKNMKDGKPAKDYDKARDKVEDARIMRNVGFITGGALLASGITIHIFF